MACLFYWYPFNLGRLCARLVSASLSQRNLFSCRRFLVELLPTAFPVGVKFRACLEAWLVRLVR